MGHRPTPRSDSDLNATARLGAPRGLPGEVSLQSFVRRVNNQGQTESCVGQALTKGIDTRLRKMGLNVPEPSAQACYTLAREEETPKGQPLEDNGSIAGDAFKAMKNLGCPREMVWPLNPAVINERLSWDVLQDASRFLVLDPYRMNEEGASRSDAIANALTQGFPVVFAQQIDNKFFDYTGGTIQLFDPDVAGGHMMCIMGFRPSPGAAGGREFLVINSWGEDWGEGGYCWMHERILADPRSDEFYVVDVAA
jgi:hypothetical protein